MNRRDLQAAQTRTDILDAAWSRFAENGYRGTTMADIAKTAGVSVQTIYDSVGSKAEIVGQLNDRIDELAHVPQRASRIDSITDPCEAIELLVQLVSEIVSTSLPILRAGSQSNEPSLVAMAEEGRRRHRGGSAAIVARIEQLGGLRSDLEPAEAADILAFLTDPSTWLVALDGFGWDLERIAALSFELAKRQLLAEPGI